MSELRTIGWSPLNTYTGDPRSQTQVVQIVFAPWERRP